MAPQYISIIKSLLAKDSSLNDVWLFNIWYLFRFLEFINYDYTIKCFLADDRCNLLADNYLLAYTFALFVKARIARGQFHSVIFFVALHIAHDMADDDNEARKNQLRFWSLEVEDEIFKQLKKRFFEKLDMNALISLDTMNKIMAIELTKDNPVWRRERSPSHAGARINPGECEMCEESKVPIIPEYLFQED